MIAFFSMSLLGLLLGLILAYSSKKFHVEVDPNVDLAIASLPGVNCGGCGYAGCTAYAEAVVLQGADPTLCAPGGIKTGMQLAHILGVSAGTHVRQVSLCHCQKRDVKVVAEYTGVSTCRGASLFGLGGGWLDCRYGCLGYGDCVNSCPFGAITMGDNQVAFVDENLCTGCKKCVVTCPRGLMRVMPADKHVHVLCSNRDKGPLANKICKNACIACKRCERTCKFDAIKVPNYLAEIDYNKCTSCGDCVKVCPHKVLVDLQEVRSVNKATELMNV